MTAHNSISEDNNFQELYHYLNNYKKTKDSILLSIIIPVYNEQDTIERVLKSLPRHKSIEIIVVDDHSTDDSIKKIKEATKYNNIHIIKHKINRGYGAALNTGIKLSRGDIFITMDSDGQHQAKDIINLVKPIIEGEADITIGSRYKGSYNYELPIATRFGEAILEIGIRFFFAQKVKNNQSGFRAFHRRTFKIFKGIIFTGYAFTTELILSAALHDFRIKEVPIDLSGRTFGSSYIILYKLLFSLFLCMYLYILKNAKRLFSKRF